MIDCVERGKKNADSMETLAELDELSLESLQSLHDDLLREVMKKNKEAADLRGKMRTVTLAIWSKRERVG